MICEARLRVAAGLPQWTVGFNDEVRPYPYARPVVVKLLSAGEKFQCKNGHIRDTKHHSDDKQGMEYEVEFVDAATGDVLDRVNRVARFFTDDADLICQLVTIGLNQILALGWKRNRKEGGSHKPVAWRIER